MPKKLTEQRAIVVQMMSTQSGGHWTSVIGHCYGFEACSQADPASNCSMIAAKCGELSADP